MKKQNLWMLNVSAQMMIISSYYNNCDLPKFSESSPNLEKIFKICLVPNIPEEKVVKTKPTRIRETATFVVQQDITLSIHMTLKQMTCQGLL